MSALLKELRPTLALALPILIGQVGQMLMGVTDTVMIGQVGRVPLAAAAFAHTVWVMVLIAALGMLLAVSILSSRAHGAGRGRDCSEYLRHGMVLAVVLGLGSTGVLLALVPWLDRFNQPVEVLHMMKPYYMLITVSLLSSLVFHVLRQYSEALGHPWAPMGILLGCVILNAFLNWVLIYGRLGAPALGLTGAGWATLFSRLAAMAALWWWLVHKSEVRREWPGVRAVPGADANPGWLAPYKRERFREMLAIGIPTAGQWIFEAGSFTLAALMMGWLGTVALAGHQIAITCASFTFMFPLSLSSAVSMRVGRSIGEGRGTLVRMIGLGAVGVGTVGMVCSSLGFALGGGLIARAFTPDIEVVAMATKLLLVAGIFQVFDGAQVVMAGALRGMTDVKVPTIITFVAYWIVSLPLAYGLAFGLGFGPSGIWSGLASGLAAAALLLGWRFLRRTAVLTN